MQLKVWLRIGRAQTYPADWFLVLVPFLHGRANFFEAVLISIFMWFVHLTSFGENSLFDYTQGYDKADESKAHHPLETGEISVTHVLNGIVWGKSLLMIIGCILTLQWSPNPLWCMFCLFMWYVWGTAYNVGLSKESIFGFLPICVCFCSMGAWAWMLSHRTLGTLGWYYLAFVFCTLLFQVTWSGYLKEMKIKERSNVLVKLGVTLKEKSFTYLHLEKGGTGTAHTQPELFFEPGLAWTYGMIVKAYNLMFGGVLLALNYSFFGLHAFILLGGVASFYCYKLIRPRVYDREKELFNMSIMEIASIYLPIPILLGWVQATALMIIGILYFFIINIILWGKPYPRV